MGFLLRWPCPRRSWTAPVGLFQFVIRLGPSMSTPAGGFHPPCATDRRLLNLESVSGAKTGDVLCTGRDLQFAMSYVSPLFEASGGSGGNDLSLFAVWIPF